LFATVKQPQGRLDVLFANAGAAAPAPLGSISEEHFDQAFHINVKGVLFTVQKALPIFTDGGSIILTGSIAASKGTKGSSVYSATKAAVRSFARCWTTDLRHRKIRVNVISPGPIETPLFGKAGLDAGANRRVQGEPGRRWPCRTSAMSRVLLRPSVTSVSRNVFREANGAPWNVTP
jgi:NAD(P)-dependent dehydrogenase (short-subunit alcohol dehydrogenase family)